MKCPKCGAEMAEVFAMIEHPLGDYMIRHPGPLIYYLCEQCGSKVDWKDAQQDGDES